MDKRRGRVKWGVNGTRSVTSSGYWKQPLKWNRYAACIRSFDCANGSHSDACPQSLRPRVFCASLADVFEDREELSLWRANLFDLIDETPNLDWLLLTKRPENVRRLWEWIKVKGHVSQNEGDGYTGYRHNVWLGTSISDQATADKVIPELLKCRDLTPVLFVSAEPLLGPVDLKPGLKIAWQCSGCRTCFPQPYRKVCPVCHREEYWSGSHPFNSRRGVGLDWVIDGAESGPHAREYRLEWSLSLQSQCQHVGVAYFRKQIGHAITGLKDKKGGNAEEWPTELRVRKFPRVTVNQ